MDKLAGLIVCEVDPVVEVPGLDAGADNSTKKKKIRIAAAVAAAGILAATAGYVMMANNYTSHFMGNTVINGTDVSDLTAEEAELMLRKQVESYALQVVFPDGSVETIKGEDIGLTYESDQTVKRLMDQQSTWKWGLSLFGVTNEYSVDVDYSYDKQTLRKVLEALPEFKDENITETKDACMEYAEADQTFRVVPEVYGNRLDVNQVMTKLIQAIDGYTPELALVEDDYVKPAVYADDAELNAQIKDLNEFVETKITLQLHDGSEYVIDNLSEWVSMDTENNRYVIDEGVLKEKALEAAAEIAERDDELFTSISFKTTKSGTVEVPCSTYGWTVDQEAEAEQLCADVVTRGEISRKPIYSRDKDKRVGDTYIEVDIRNQEVFLYRDGKLIVDAPCVSGTDVSAERRSDRGLFYIYKKLKDHTMLGPTDPKTGQPSYASHTNFATYYNGGEAFHDASWRSQFGGNTYIRSGSHGCINMSYASAKAIYENSEIGMPVIVFGSTKH